jgi:hypothetical protein
MSQIIPESIFYFVTYIGEAREPIGGSFQETKLR